MNLQLLVVILLATASSLVSCNKNSSNMKELKIRVPFLFSKTIDPRNVFTVGDQMLSEHLFAFHSASNSSGSELKLFSDISILADQNLVRLKLVRNVMNSDGDKLSIEEICKTVKDSMSDTKHTKYSSLLEKITCNDPFVDIHLKSIPINFEYWIRSIDFAIQPKELTPVSMDHKHPTTGPYKLVSLKNDEVNLTANKYFPSELRSNDVSEVNIKSYKSSEFLDLIEGRDFDLAYIYGHMVDDNLIKALKKEKYKIQMFPNEWLLYFGCHDSLNIEERRYFAGIVDEVKNKVKNEFTVGQLAYSITPAGRGFGVSKKDYEKLNNPAKNGIVNKKFKIATLDEWANVPFIKKVLNELKSKVSVEIVLFTRANFPKVYDKKEADIYLSPMGLSAADPLGNFSFLIELNTLIHESLSVSQIQELYTFKGFDAFRNEIYEIETKILSNRSVIPIGHFPGVVAESDKVHRSEEYAWDWGIQAWTYKTN